MSVKAGSFTPTTGNISIAGLTFLPEEVLLRAGAATGSTHSDKILYANGWTTANNQSYDYGFSDGTHWRCQGGTDKCIRLYKWDTGTSAFIEILAATFVSFDTNGGGDFGFTLNWSAATGQQVRYIARN